ncbi:MAG TPA: isochorismatase family protein [Methylomirabilota bacterium]|jgi:class 3 adenylate cyclase|nr:isochorismatase family protein [Methylomirabilota bacterium]
MSAETNKAPHEVRKLAAIMFTDIVGFSRHMGSNEARMLRLLDVHNQLIRHAVTDHHGIVTTENCCHATARDALFRDYKVVFLSDATATFDYPDVGQGGMSAAEVHRATLVILSVSTAHVMTTEEFMARTAAVNNAAAAAD